MLHGHGTNGAGNGAYAPSGATQSSSDVAKLLNLPGVASSSGPAPRVMSAADAVGWSPTVQPSAARARNTKFVVGFLAVVGVIITRRRLGLLPS